MASLFQGTPQTATSYTSSSTETPRWMQDAIYNQIQLATNTANRDYQPYSLPRVAEVSPLQQQAHQQVQSNQGFYKPAMQTATSGLQGLATQGTSAGLRTAQAGYLQPGLVQQNLQRGQDAYRDASTISASGAADPYLRSAAQTSVAGIDQYMSPYTEGVTNRIAQLGARNLSENILPGVSDSFIRAGQFGSGRMGEFGSRAVRDTQDAILGQQAQALQQGYGQALTTSQADRARMAVLGGTAGSLAGQDMGALTSLGSAQTSAGQAQQQYGINSAQAAQGAEAADLLRQLSANVQVGGLQQLQQQMNTADAGALESAGQAQQGQAQRGLDAAYQQFLEQRNYPQSQLDWLNTQIRGMAPIVPTSTTQTGSTTGGSYSPSPLSQLAAGMYAYKGLTS